MIVIILSLIGVIFGLISAIYGRKSESKKKKIIEGIVLFFWVPIAPVLTGYFSLTPLSVFLIGLAIALLISGGYRKYIYQFIGGVMGFIIGFYIVKYTPFLELLSLFGIIAIVIFTLIGISFAEKYKEYVSIIATTYAGANLFSFGILGIVFLFEDKPILFLQNVMITMLIPIIGGFFEEVELIESVIYLISFLLILCCGYFIQKKQYQDELKLVNEVSAY
jgi:hypothetical protein